MTLDVCRTRQLSGSELRSGFDTLNNHNRCHACGQTDHMIETAAAAECSTDIADEQGIHLDDVRIDRKQVPRGSVTSAEIVDSNVATQTTGLREILVCSFNSGTGQHFSDFQNEARCKIRPSCYSLINLEPNSSIGQTIARKIAAQNNVWIAVELVKGEIDNLLIERRQRVDRLEMRDKLRGSVDRTVGLNQAGKAFLVEELITIRDIVDALR